MLRRSAGLDRVVTPGGPRHGRVRAWPANSEHIAEYPHVAATYQPGPKCCDDDNRRLEIVNVRFGTSKSHEEPDGDCHAWRLVLPGGGRGGATAYTALCFKDWGPLAGGISA